MTSWQWSVIKALCTIVFQHTVGMWPHDKSFQEARQLIFEAIHRDEGNQSDA